MVPTGWLKSQGQYRRGARAVRDNPPPRNVPLESVKGNPHYQRSHQGSHIVSGRISLLALAVSFYCFLHPSCRSHAASRVGTFFSSKQSFIPLLFLPLPESGHLTSLSLNYV